MKRGYWGIVLFLTLAALTQARIRQPGEALPPPTIPEGFGVNIHFTTPLPGEMERFAEAGYRWARMDLLWDSIERRKGEYDFTAYDALVDHLAKVRARPLFILDYGNDLYQSGSPSTPEARAAFARFAATAARRYAGKGIIFEIWNEPNIFFWKPKPNAKDYALLALETAKAMREADPNVTIIAPATSGFPWEFLEEIFQMGLLAHIDAVSVHPYRGDEPETAAAEYVRLRGLIAQYAPPGKEQLPIVASEWGYSTREGGNISEVTQAQYLVRMWLANLASGVTLSIFYDWRDDGDDPKENEHRFGTVRRDFQPKPSFTAAKELIRQLSGYHFRHRLAAKDRNEWRLLFQKGDTDELALVTWNAAKEATATAAMPQVRTVKPGDTDFADLRALVAFRFPYGPLAQSQTKSATLTVTHLSQPGYLGKTYHVDIHAVSREDSVATPRDLDRIPVVSVPRLAPKRAGVEEKFPVTLPLNLRRLSTSEYTLRFRLPDRKLPTLAPLTLARIDPLVVSVAPAGKDFVVQLENPSGTALKGEVLLMGSKTQQAFQIAKGQKSYRVMLRWSGEGVVGVSVRDSNGLEIATVPQRRYEKWAAWPSAFGEPAGFGKVLFVENVAQKPEPLDIAYTPDASPTPTALRFNYQFDAGWRYAQIAPDKKRTIPREATALVIWIYNGDATGDYLRTRFRDATGQTFQRDLGQLTWRGWRPITIPLDGTGVGVSWGGANDRILHLPLTWEGVLLVDSADRSAHSGTLLLTEPHYILRLKK